MKENFNIYSARNFEESFAMGFYTTMNTALMNQQHISTQLNLIEANTLSNTRGQNAKSDATLKFYNKVKSKWEEWCSKHQFPEMSRILVTPDKANLFIHQTVLKTQESESATITSAPSYSTLNKHASALRWIHKQQQDQGANSYPPPRSGSLGELLGAMHYEDYNMKKRARHDRGIGKLFVMPTTLDSRFSNVEHLIVRQYL